MAAWIGVAMLGSLLLYAAVVYVVATREEAADSSKGRAELADARRKILVTMALVAPLFVSLATTGALLLTRRVMRPIDDLVRAAAEMSSESLNRHLPVPTQDDELRSLVLTLNALFARLERGYAAQATFAFDASHELRTPLAVITTELEIALRRPRSPKEWEAAAGTVLAEARRASRLVEALLRYARAGTIGPRSERVNLAEVADRLLNAFALSASKAQLALSSSWHDGEPVSALVQGDADAIETALSVVLNNALRYTPPGGRVQLSVTTNFCGCHAAHVDDSGHGVSESDAVLIFVPFGRGEQGRRTDAQSGDAGSGLGLAMAKRICEAHGGSISLSRSPWGGARFSLLFPVA